MNIALMMKLRKANKADLPRLFGEWKLQTYNGDLRGAITSFNYYMDDVDTEASRLLAQLQGDYGRDLAMYFCEMLDSYNPKLIENPLYFVGDTNNHIQIDLPAPQCNFLIVTLSMSLPDFKNIFPTRGKALKLDPATYEQLLNLDPQTMYVERLYHNGFNYRSRKSLIKDRFVD